MMGKIIAEEDCGASWEIEVVYVLMSSSDHTSDSQASSVNNFQVKLQSINNDHSFQ
jgi:hypothetical protein